MAKPVLVPLENYEEYPQKEMYRRAVEFEEHLAKRRSIRDFADRPVPQEIIDSALRAAGSAPSEANLQPWHFVVVSGEKTKQRIRQAAEKEEQKFYELKASPEWLAVQETIGIDTDKPFLESAPYLIAVFSQTSGQLHDGRRFKHYYPDESAGIATGLLITALHNAGLACLTHTPSPTRLLNRILQRPKNERPFLLLVVGYPAENAQVPNLSRKSLEEFVTYVDR
ncbi:MAG: nitroreductase family protein [Gammaproteobacteria bacterium]|nr:nitroreductase family protein [Gammaproteobacteria bacterium]